jgi:PAS domain S-box-containing protein
MNEQESIGNKGENKDYFLRTVKGKEDKYKMIFDNVNDMIVFLDTHGKIIEANDRLKDIFGIDPQEAKGKSITSMGSFKIKDLSPLKSFSLIMGLVLGGKTITFLQLETKNKNGNTIFLESSTTILKKDGKNMGYLAITRDITERKKIEDALRERNEELEKINKLSLGRELKMIELKNRVQELEEKLNKPQ